MEEDDDFQLEEENEEIPGIQPGDVCGVEDDAVEEPAAEFPPGCDPTEQGQPTECDQVYPDDEPLTVVYPCGQFDRDDDECEGDDCEDDGGGGGGGGDGGGGDGEDDCPDGDDCDDCNPDLDPDCPKPDEDPPEETPCDPEIDPDCVIVPPPCNEDEEDCPDIGDCDCDNLDLQPGDLGYCPPEKWRKLCGENPNDIPDGPVIPNSGGEDFCDCDNPDLKEGDIGWCPDEKCPGRPPQPIPEVPGPKPIKPAEPAPITKPTQPVGPGPGDKPVTKPPVTDPKPPVTDPKPPVTDPATKPPVTDPVTPPTTDCEKLFRDINLYRQVWGRKPLAPNQKLQAAATWLVNDMVATSNSFDPPTPTLSHIDSLYGEMVDRVRAFGWTGMTAENVGHSPDGGQLVNWIKSNTPKKPGDPTHRDNMIQPAHTDGAVACKDGFYVFVSGFMPNDEQKKNPPPYERLPCNLPADCTPDAPATPAELTSLQKIPPGSAKCAGLKPDTNDCYKLCGPGTDGTPGGGKRLYCDEAETIPRWGDCPTGKTPVAPCPGEEPPQPEVTEPAVPVSTPLSDPPGSARCVGKSTTIMTPDANGCYRLCAVGADGTPGAGDTLTYPGGAGRWGACPPGQKPVKEPPVEVVQCQDSYEALKQYAEAEQAAMLDYIDAYNSDMDTVRSGNVAGAFATTRSGDANQAIKWGTCTKNEVNVTRTNPDGSQETVLFNPSHGGMDQWDYNKPFVCQNTDNATCERLLQATHDSNLPYSVPTNLCPEQV